MIGIAAAKFLILGLIVSNYSTIFRNVNGAFNQVAATISPNDWAEQLDASGQSVLQRARECELVQSGCQQYRGSGQRAGAVGRRRRLPDRAADLHNSVLLVQGPYCTPLGRWCSHSTRPLVSVNWHAVTW